MGFSGPETLPVRLFASWFRKSKRWRARRKMEEMGRQVRLMEGRR